MIETYCSCGGVVRADESAAGAAATCGGCGRPVRLASAEPLATGMAVGDFDARLVVRAGPIGLGETIALGGVPDLVVGKTDQRHVRLDGPTVSRTHAKLVRLDFGPSRWKVVDTGSTNGVFINGNRVAEAELADGDLLRVGDYELRYVTAVPALSPPMAPALSVGNMLVAARATAAAAVRCPSCSAGYGKGTKICVGCGIYISTGRPLVTSRELDEDDLAVRADTWIRIVSWVVPFGLFPIASEAFATRRPRAIWWIAGITVFASLLFFVPYYAGDFAVQRPWMMWCGSGDAAVRFRGETITLPADTLGHFHLYQLITQALIHAGVMHLAGNLVFLLVFGVRVNELLGNRKMAIVYPVLAVSSALIYYWATLDEPTHASLGASGAIMGLAGMYVVFFPVQRVVMTIWLRLTPWSGLGLLMRCPLWYKLFRVRGAWLLGLWVGLNDVLPTVLAHARGDAVHDGVAHWAHLGGFATGAALAVGLLVARQVNARGSDLLSVALGSRAWPILGRPSERSAA